MKEKPFAKSREEEVIVFSLTSFSCSSSGVYINSSIGNIPNNEYKTTPLFPMLPMEKFVKHPIHRLSPNFEIGSLVWSNQR